MGASQSAQQEAADARLSAEIDRQIDVDERSWAFTGIPPARRPQAWPRLLGARHLRESQPPGYFEALCALSREPERLVPDTIANLRCVQKDVFNSRLGDPAKYGSGSSGSPSAGGLDPQPEPGSEARHEHGAKPPCAFLNSLATVLSAFAVHHHRLGYLPSIGYIAAKLVSVIQDEELAFWCLVALIEGDRRADDSTASARAPFRS